MKVRVEEMRLKKEELKSEDEEMRLVGVEGMS